MLLQLEDDETLQIDLEGRVSHYLQPDGRREGEAAQSC